MNELRYNGDRAKLAITFLWINMAALAFQFIADLLYINMIRARMEGYEIEDSVLRSNDIFQVIAGGIVFVVYTITGITFIQWFRRAYFNLHQLVGGLAHSEGWAAGAWFVPIINWFRPYSIMAELHEETHRFLTDHVPGYTGSINKDRLGWWWFGWVIGGILFYISFRLLLNPSNIEQLYHGYVLGIMAAMVQIPLTFVIVRIVRAYASLEDVLINLELADTGYDEELPPIQNTE